MNTPCTSMVRCLPRTVRTCGARAYLWQSLKHRGTPAAVSDAVSRVDITIFPGVPWLPPRLRSPRILRAAQKTQYYLGHRDSETRRHSTITSAQNSKPLASESPGAVCEAGVAGSSKETTASQSSSHCSSALPCRPDAQVQRGWEA